eukprot:2358637-Rhodomonas_salina.2
MSLRCPAAAAQKPTDIGWSTRSCFLLLYAGAGCTAHRRQLTRHSHGDLELARKVAAAVQRLLGVAGDDAGALAPQHTSAPQSGTARVLADALRHASLGLADLFVELLKGQRDLPRHRHVSVRSSTEGQHSQHSGALAT